MANGKKSFGETIQALPKPVLFLILIMVTTIPLFKEIPMSIKADPSSEALYERLAAIPEGSTILIASDWTNSTRGESQGHFKALLRILMRRNVKFGMYSTGDPQALQAARDTILKINAERKKKSEREYKRWEDYVSIGYFPNAEAAAQAIQNNIRTAFGDKKDFDSTGKPKPVFESPVLAHIQRVKDFPMLVIVTPSKTSNITIERVTEVPLVMFVTGVMGPESQVYFDSGQIKGLAKGLKGVYDIEKMMEGTFPGQTNADNGSKYYPTLNFALGLLIIAVLVGNLGMVLSRRRTE